ncbi:hypothetical protein ACGRL8_12185 [Vibrio rumoiensis]|uniref:hypothetical protein n=1 Tax=Vibrio rumoiensis TaxID=76258 RepID=UPI003748C31F
MKAYLTLKNLLSVVIAFIFIQSMFFKFTDSPETIYIFSTLGQWSGFPWFGNYGGYMVGLVELIASILLFTRWHAFGAMMALAVISGAIIFHLFTPLGVAMPTYADSLLLNSDTAIHALTMATTDEKYNVIRDDLLFIPTDFDSGTLFIMACVVWLSALTLTVKQLKDPSSNLRKLFS